MDATLTLKEVSTLLITVLIPILGILGSILGLLWKKVNQEIAASRKASEKVENRMNAKLEKLEALMNKRFDQLDNDHKKTSNKTETRLDSSLFRIKEDMEGRITGLATEFDNCRAMHNQTDARRQEEHAEDARQAGQVITEIEHLKKSLVAMELRMSKFEDRLEKMDDRTTKGIQTILDTLHYEKRKP